MKQKNKLAIVTGAGRGIGKACAIALLKDGWNTIFVGRTLTSLELSIEEAGEVAAEALAISCDVSDYQQVSAMFQQVVDVFGRVDLLFNNAGISGPAGTIDEISVEDWTETLNTNLAGAFNCAKLAFSVMKKQTPQGGRIINNGSVAAHTPRPQSVAYCVTKHGISGLTKSLSLDGRAFNIASGQIDIGNVSTEMTIPMTQGMLQSNGEKRVEPVFDMQHVVTAALYMANLPLEVNVQTMTVMATKMPFIGRG